MTEPRTPDDQSIEPGNNAPEPSAAARATPAPLTTSPSAPAGSVPDPADSPTQAWPSLAGPPSDARMSTPAGEPAPAHEQMIAAAPIAPGASIYEPAPSIPASQIGAVGEIGTASPPDAPRGGRSRLRWGLALVGVLIVAAGSLLVVSLVGGRPTPSIAMGYMPADTVSYEEVRLDLPGDQRTKLASFLKTFPGFTDQSAVEPKLDELFDKVLALAKTDHVTWTTDIKPWFGGQLAIGAGVPDASSGSAAVMTGAGSGLIVATVTDRAKAIAWLLAVGDRSTLNRSTYGDADLFIPAGGSGGMAAAVNDKVLLVGSTGTVKAAIDSNGKGAFDQNEDVKAALATVDKDYVLFSVVRTRALADGYVKLISKSQPGVLDKSQIDETVLGLLPAWQVSTGRFENDAIVTSSASPSWAIGVDGTNRASTLVGHVPAKTLVYLDSHDVGPALTALVAKFRALPEAKAAFTQFDQAMSLLGGADAVYGWWGDTAVVVSQLDDGTIGGGLVVHPRDAAAADRLLSTLGGFLALGGGNAGIATRTEDHNGTKVTIVDLSGMPGVSSAGLPPGYKPEFAWATNADVAVMGYGASFVEAVLDAGPGKSLADDARFKALLGRVGADNMGMTFVDVAALRNLLEPLAQAKAPADAWTRYTTEIQPYLKPLDALISSIRKDGVLDRGTGAFTVH